MPIPPEVKRAFYWAFGLMAVLAMVLGFVAYRTFRIHGYLGTNRGPQAEWKGFIGNYHSDAILLRNFYKNLNCRLHALEGTTCPTVPPSTSPKNPGGYPP